MKQYFTERLWLLYAILAALCWGILAKFIPGDISPYANHLMFAFGMLFTIPIVFRKCRIREDNLKGLSGYHHRRSAPASFHHCIGHPFSAGAIGLHRVCGESVILKGIFPKVQI